MDIGQLWDIQVLTYVVLSTIVVLIVLGLLSATTRRLRNLMSEVESLRREMRLIDDSVRNVGEHLRALHPQRPSAASIELGASEVKDASVS